MYLGTNGWVLRIDRTRTSEFVTLEIPRLHSYHGQRNQNQCHG